MILYDECKGCLFSSQMKKVEAEQSDEAKLDGFKRAVKALCENPPANYCAPLLMRDIDRLHAKIFGAGIDYSREKSLFNALLSGMEGELYEKIMSSPDPLGEALKYAMASNYIDFARLSDLNAGAVDEVMKAAARAQVGSAALDSLKGKLKTAKTLCFLHDNCGEIVLDKILIRVIKKLYPQVEITSVVRGGAIINDVTLSDAEQVGLSSVARVIDNGTNVPGTYLKEISAETLNALKTGDIVISKGLGNLETLYGEGFHAFYAFTCKCNHIAERFSSPLWSAVFAEES